MVNNLVATLVKMLVRNIVVLWDRIGWRGEVGFFPLTEPDARMLVRAKREWRRGDLR